MSLRIRLAFAILLASSTLFAVECSSVAAACAKVSGEEELAAIGASQLFPAADVKLEPNDGATVRMEGDVAVVDVVPERSFSGAKFVLCEPFALNPYKTLSVEVSNRTARALSFGFYGIHRGNTTWYAPQRFRLEPNQAKTVAAPNRRKCYVMAPGSQGLDGMIGYDARNFPTSVNASGAIDFFIVFCDRQKEPASFDVKRIWADGARPASLLDIGEKFFPFVDEFGQYMHADWPGKVHSLDELKAAAKAEESALLSNPESP